MNAVVLALSSAAMIGVGFSLQKHGVASEFPEIAFGTLLHRWRTIVRALLGNWVWLAGMALGVGGGLVQVQAMAEGDLSLVQPLFNTSNLWAMTIGLGFFGERLGRWEWVGVGIGIAGAVVVSLSPLESTSLRPALLPLAGITVGAATLIAMAQLAGRAGRGAISVEFLLSLAAGLSFGLQNLYMKVMTWHAGEALGHLDLRSLRSWLHVLSSAPLYAVLLWVILGTVFVQAAFSHGRVALVTPICTGVTTVVPMLAAAWVFGERFDLPRGVGIALSILGPLVLAFAARARPTIPDVLAETP
ncbi:MAG: EamA family transporter [bacterium]